MPASAVSNHRLLVVEDDAGMRQLLVKALSADTREIVDAADGAEAIGFLRERPPFDIVISDVKMPNADGHAVLQEIVQHHTNTKVILITAFGDVDEYLDSMDRGAFEYLTKPLKMLDLTRVVNRALGVEKGQARPRHPARHIGN